jgi:hypothetical protein
VRSFWFYAPPVMLAVTSAIGYLFEDNIRCARFQDLAEEEGDLDKRYIGDIAVFARRRDWLLTQMYDLI